MNVELLTPDVAPGSVPQRSGDSKAFADALGGVGAQLEKATQAEDAFAGGRGSLQSAMYERARADVALSVATASAQRAAQAINAVLNMQV
jgi:flagellar hook-basal body complex protein FliE